MPRHDNDTTIIHAHARIAVGATAVALLLALPATPVRAEHHSVVAAGATQCTNDPGVQLVGMLMESPGENFWTNCIQFEFFDPSGAPTGTFVVGNDPPSAAIVANVGTQQLSATPGAPPIHIVIPAALEGAMIPGGQVCYQGRNGFQHIPSGDDCRDIRICQTIAPATCGCDGLPGSGVVADACGVCGGDGSSCAGGTCGDVNGSDTVDITDALMVAQYDVGMRACAQLPTAANCDIAPAGGTPDGNCNIIDALRLAQCDVGLSSCAFDCQPFVCPGP